MRFTEEISFGTRLALFPAVGYLLAIAVSFLTPLASLVLYAVVPVPYILGLFYRRMGLSNLLRK